MPIIASYNKPEDAYLAASLLEGNGIQAMVQDAETVSMDWMISNAIGGVKLVVAKEDVDAAKEILKLPKLRTEILVCPHCGSNNTRIRELSLWSVFSWIFLGAPVPAKSRKVDCLDCKKAFPLQASEKAENNHEP